MNIARKNLGAELALPIETKREFVCLGKAFKTREAAEAYRRIALEANVRRMPRWGGEPCFPESYFDVTERLVPLPAMTPVEWM